MAFLPPYAPARSFLRRLGLIAAVLGALFANGSASAAEQPGAERVLTVGAATDNFPYSYRDQDGRLTGYGVDLLDAVAEVMRVRLRRTESTSAEDVENLRAGRHDIGQFHASDRGSAHALYSQPILVNTGDLFVRTGDRRFASLEDLRQLRARVAGHVQARDYLLARGFDPARFQLATSGEAMRALASGQVDAVLTSRLTGLTQAHHLGLRNVTSLGWDLRDFRVVFCIATRPDDRELLEQINEALATLSTTGRLGEIYARWFGRYESRPASLREMLGPAAVVLALALLVTMALLRRQHLLRRRLARQAEELRLSHEALAEAQQFARLGHSRRSLDPAIPAEWSEETYRIFECDPDGAVPGFDRLVALAIPTDCARWQAALEHTRCGGEPYDFDITIDTPAGHRKILNVRGRPTFDPSGRQDGTFGTVQDVTASRTAAAALQQSELLLRALYEHLPLALGVVERRTDDWYILSINPEGVRQLGTATAVPGVAITTTGLPADRLQFWRERFDRSTVQGETLRFEFASEHLRKHFSAAVVPLILPGLPPRCCLLSEEITTRKLKDAELDQGRRLRAIGELVGGIAHEFNNLLTPIALNTELLLGQCADRPALRDELGLIADAARRAGELTRRLLTFGRRTDPQPELVALPAIVESTIALVRHTFDRRIAITVDLPASLPPLHLPPGDLQQILLNLLLNARDALAGKLARPPVADWSAHIAVEAVLIPASELPPREATQADGIGQWLRVTVRDNGCGIAPAVRERLFEPFFTTKGVGSGTGLGLATIWHLVTEFGGRVDVDSIPDEGSAFHLGLPVRIAPAEPPAAAPLPEPPRPVALQRRFLLADDEISVSRVVTRLLERKGHQVTAVADGLAAWEALTADPSAFDAVIMDLNMPGLTGTELARRARALPYTRPLIVMSGRIDDDERARLLDSGVDVLIDKPFSIVAFETALVRVFSGTQDAPRG